MTVDQMIEMLTDLSEEGAGDMEVAVAMQSHYPVSLEVAGIANSHDLEEGDDEYAEDVPNYVWITTDGSLRDVPYPSADLWDLARR